ncbi:MAG: DUF3536 domain-containing protein [Pyrinomonadaceae bacterium]
MTTALVVHGHFYQPPRENPRTGEVEREPSAAPFHDWNERIHFECYRANAHTRIYDSRGRVERIVNNYKHLNFNFGPTLLHWLERHHPDTYARVLAADRESAARRGGHGNAIAQGYHHAILPLCNERDRRTQVRWGVADFRHRFGREPESLWLPETACDAPTLATLIDEGLQYVILSPFQGERVRASGDEAWRNVADGDVDTSLPYKFLHPDNSGRSLAVFFYDGGISNAIAFDGLLSSSQKMIDRFERAARSDAALVSVATDGESYGHHYRFGELCLAYALEREAPARGFQVTNYGEFLASHAPTVEVEIKRGADGRGTAWSCAHGLGRWSRDCGCHAGAPAGWNQKWREPVRAALDFLRDDAALKFESAGGELLRDPWATRDAYVELLVEREASPEAFLSRHAARTLDEPERARAVALLEIQRCAMAMYTSCGWFFNDISGIESTLVLKYAGRAIELMEMLDLAPPRRRFLEILAGAQSNVRRLGNGVDVFLRGVNQAARAKVGRVEAHTVAPQQPEDVRASKMFESVAEELLTKAVGVAVAVPTSENVEVAVSWVRLARSLNQRQFLARAQEIFYEALEDTLTLNRELRELGLLLDIAPDSLASPVSLTADDDASAAETASAQTVG